MARVITLKAPAPLPAARPGRNAVEVLPAPAPDRPDALPGLSIVITSRDDEATAVAAVSAAAAIAARTSRDYEILAVDDASSDATAAVIARIARPGGRLRLLLHSQARGPGAAQRSGIACASMPWVLLLDASDELDLEALEDFLPLAPDHDLLLGWRVMRRGPVAARANSAAWSVVVRRTLGLAVHDLDCPLKLARRDLLARLDLGAAGATIGTELVARARASDARLAEIPVHQRPGLPGSGKSGQSPRLGATSLVQLARLRGGMPGRSARRPGRTGLGLVVAVAAIFAGVGWLYLLRGANVIGAGPLLDGALPLQQLAGGDAQPLVRMAAAWLPAGALAGLGLAMIGQVRRPVLASGAVAAVLLAVSGAASDAVAGGLHTTARLLPQLGMAGFWAAVLLVASGAAIAIHLPHRLKR
jgi:hypothetical protein